jgi:hypothetical protein
MENPQRLMRESHKDIFMRFGGLSYSDFQEIQEKALSQLAPELSIAPARRMRTSARPPAVAI